MRSARIDNWHILRELGPLNSLKLLGSRVLSLDHYFVLRKNLMEPEPETPAVGAKLALEPIGPADIEKILKSLASLTPAEKRDVLGYLHFYESGFKNCFVMRRDDQVAYMQTLIYPEQNDLIERKYRLKFYPLKESQVMVENVFTFVAFRGLGCLQQGTRKLLDLARSQGYRSAVCYIRKDRIVSLNEFIKMGFKITRMMPEYKVLGRVWRDL